MITKIEINAAAQSITDNEVQQTYIKDMLGIFTDCTDDIFDEMNYLAALTKAHDFLLREIIEREAAQGIAPQRVKDLLSSAKRDWVLPLSVDLKIRSALRINSQDVRYLEMLSREYGEKDAADSAEFIPPDVQNRLASVAQSVKALIIELEEQAKIRNSKPQPEEESEAPDSDDEN